MVVRCCRCCACVSNGVAYQVVVLRMCWAHTTWGHQHPFNTSLSRTAMFAITGGPSGLDVPVRSTNSRQPSPLMPHSRYPVLVLQVCLPIIILADKRPLWCGPPLHGLCPATLPCVSTGKPSDSTLTLPSPAVCRSPSPSLEMLTMPPWWRGPPLPGLCPATSRCVSTLSSPTLRCAAVSKGGWT